MIFRNYIITTCFLLFLSCNNMTPVEKELNRVLGKKVNLTMFDKVYHKGNSFDFNSIQQKYSYFTIVYIQYGCSPCYSKYVNWSRNKEDFLSVASHSIIFIVEGNMSSIYEDFINEVRKEEPTIEDNYYTIIDTGFDFLKGNEHIPFWMIENSLLIDDQNRVRLVGDPMGSKEMLRFFREIVE